MSRGTKKVKIAGKYGTRYGVKVRKRMRDMESQKIKRYPCPECCHVAVKRVDTGIWKCRKCGTTFAGGAYAPKPTTASFTRSESKERITEPTLKPEEAAVDTPIPSPTGIPEEPGTEKEKDEEIPKELTEG